MKTLTAKQRTVSLFAGSTWGHEQANLNAPDHGSWPRATRIALAYPPALHLRLSTEPKTLCGQAITLLSELSGPTDGLGTCQHCRAEASRLRAVVGR
jgi:hypothetical protein